MLVGEFLLSPSLLLVTLSKSWSFLLEYNFSDTWSCGCVFGELLKGGIILAGKSSNNQAEVIFDMLGYPTDSDVSSMKVSSTKLQEVLDSYEYNKSKTTADLTYLYTQTVIYQKDRRTTVYNTVIIIRRTSSLKIQTIFISDRF